MWGSNLCLWLCSPPRQALCTLSERCKRKPQPGVPSLFCRTCPADAWEDRPISACLRWISLPLLCILSYYLFNKLAVSYFFYIPNHSVNWIILFNIKKKHLIKYILSWKKDFLLLCHLSWPQLFTSHQTSLSNYFCNPWHKLWRTFSCPHLCLSPDSICRGCSTLPWNILFLWI